MVQRESEEKAELVIMLIIFAVMKQHTIQQ